MYICYVFVHIIILFLLINIVKIMRKCMGMYSKDADAKLRNKEHKFRAG